jgi:anti-sigma factor RsiW
MTRHPPSGEPPSPEELAAYYDGELTAADRRRVEDWLADHPEAAAELRRLRRLEALWQAAAPAEPTSSAWAGVLRGIEQGVSPVRGARPSARAPRRAGLALVAAASAAVVLLALALGGRHPPAPLPPPQEPFPVASDADVEIVSVDADGAAAVLVGGLPLRHPIVLMAPGDVALRSVERDRDGQFPDVRLQADSDLSPMILGPVAAGLAGEHQ